MVKNISDLFKVCVIVLIRFYQVAFSSLFGHVCRFEPSCSNYALQAFSIYGLLRGGFLALKRVLRCHPFHAGGDDPLPPIKSQYLT